VVISGFFALAVVIGLSFAQNPGSQGEVQAQVSSTGTNFTYQGELRAGENPVTDECDMAFHLYDLETGGSELGTITRTLPITDGLFTANLDFGNNAFHGEARWMGVQVKCPNDVAYTDLGRQELTAAPYTLYSLSTGALQGHPVTSTVPTADQVLTWNGAQWAPTSAQGVPSSMIMFFDLSSCPTGWSEYTNARGRYLVGVPAGGAKGITVGNALSNGENRSVGRHAHSINNVGHSHSINDPGHIHSINDPKHV
jgi:hypothetical protein